LVEALSNMEAYCDVCTSGPEVSCYMCKSCVLAFLQCWVVTRYKVTRYCNALII